jgi:cardiolipin synthase
MDVAEQRERTIAIEGNRLTPIIEGPELLAALLKLIDQAKCSLRLLYYIYTADRTGTLVRDSLIRAIDRGVEVSLLIDGFGSGRTPEGFFRDLQDRGARFCRFNPSYGRRYLLRNHQKLTLADAETKDCQILIGGFNIENGYFARIDEVGWRDLGLLVDGPAAARVMPYYDALMAW